MGTCTLILKATRLCNLRCGYCFDWRDGPGQVMSFEVLARLTAAVTEDPRHDLITFNWHGGEPTVLPLGFFEKALVLQHRLRRPGQRLVNTVQTNATRLNDAWLDLFVDYDFRVGVSIDGPASIHDRHRVNVRGEGTFERVREGLSRLQSRNIAYGVIMVVDRETLDLGAEALLEFMLQEGLTDVALNFVMPTPKDQQVPAQRHYVEPREVSRFLMEMWHARQRLSAPIGIRELDALERSLQGGFPGPCTLSGACLGLVYRIEPNGDVFHCDYFGVEPEYRWGSVLTDSFADLRRSSTLKEALRREKRAKSRLRSCEHFNVCHGWCPHVRATAERFDADHDPGCCGLEPLITHLREHPGSTAGSPVETPSRPSALTEFV